MQKNAAGNPLPGMGRKAQAAEKQQSTDGGETRLQFLHGLSLSIPLVRCNEFKLVHIPLHKFPQLVQRRAVGIQRLEGIS